jgi:hypothetical protein
LALPLQFQMSSRTAQLVVVLCSAAASAEYILSGEFSEQHLRRTAAAAPAAAAAAAAAAASVGTCTQTTGKKLSLTTVTVAGLPNKVLNTCYSYIDLQEKDNLLPAFVSADNLKIIKWANNLITDKTRCVLLRCVFSSGVLSVLNEHVSSQQTGNRSRLS